MRLIESTVVAFRFDAVQSGKLTSGRTQKHRVKDLFPRRGVETGDASGKAPTFAEKSNTLSRQASNRCRREAMTFPFLLRNDAD